jgi:hypothetical protein
MSEAAAALTGDNGGADAGAAGQSGNAGTAVPASQESWVSGLDEDTQAFVKNKGWDSPAKVVESYHQLEKFAGGSRNLLEMPGEDADEEALGQFYNRLGRPESPDNYELDLPDDVDQGLTDWFKDAAFRHGLTNNAAKNLYSEFNEKMIADAEAYQEEMSMNSEHEMAELKKEWGRAYDANIDAGKRAVAALGYDADKLSALEAKLGTGEMMTLFATLGSKMGEASFEGGERSGSSSFSITPGEAKQQITDLKTNKDFMDKYLSGDKDAVAKMARLSEAAYAS